MNLVPDSNQTSRIRIFCESIRKCFTGCFSWVFWIFQRWSFNKKSVAKKKLDDSCILPGMIKIAKQTITEHQTTQMIMTSQFHKLPLIFVLKDVKPQCNYCGSILQLTTNHEYEQPICLGECSKYSDCNIDFINAKWQIVTLS